MGDSRKSGNARLTFNAEHRYGGTTFVDQGTLALDGAGKLGPGAVVIGAGATLDLSAVGGARAIGALSGRGMPALGAHPSCFCKSAPARLSPHLRPGRSMKRTPNCTGSTSTGRKWSAYVDLTTERNSRPHVNMASAGVRLRW